MSVSGQTEDASASAEMGAPIREIYEQKAVSKVVRVLTVLAYLLSVSLAAILLSVYYICVWKSPDLPLMNDTEELSAKHRSELKDYIPSVDSTALYGGSNFTMNDVTTESTPSNMSEEFANAMNIGRNDSVSDQGLLSNSPSTLQPPYNDSVLDIGIYNDTDTTT
ncbi:uncharacterized protein LOC131847580 isoform X2 [Achroia grisella]|uniref:uncharacterized protein LOC131847580 isoform X2 n=1 Tax=Achroia grisella TaxID=688607 RepID=UPI0027D31592|nr:uncharacterized protein LOC131847580 isoform X2 [Achroia grisella]